MYQINELFACTMAENKLYVGHLLESCSEGQLRDAFCRFGEIVKIEMKAGFAFVSFADRLACDEALKELSNATIPGSDSLNIQIARGRQDRDRDRDRGEKSRGQDRDKYRIQLENVIPQATWMDLKDFARDRGVHANYAVREVSVYVTL